MKKLYQLTGIAVLIGMTACKDNTSDIPGDDNQQNSDLPEWYYTRAEWTANSRTEKLFLRNLS